MNIFLRLLTKNIDDIARLHNLNDKIFLLIYLLSIIPIYFGYFLIFYGATKETSIKKILKLKLSDIKINITIAVGIIISIFGILMPYLYILFWGNNLPFIFYLVVFLIIFILLLFFMFKITNIFRRRKTINIDGIEIIKKEVIADNSEKEKMWEIYDASFIELNKNAPCRQSFDKVHFIDLMDKADVLKYLIFEKDTRVLIGLGMITNNFENTPWISEEYFKEKFKNNFDKKNIYYFMGIAIADSWRYKGYATVLVKKMTDELSKDAIVGFDNSKRMNFFIPHFADNSGRRKKRTFLDSQNYYIVS